MSTKVAMSYFVLWFPHHQSFSLSNRVSFLENEKKKSHTVQGRENMAGAAPVGFRVWPRNVAQVETSALVSCHAVFANSLTTAFLVVCGVLSRGDAAKLVNNIHYLLCDPLQRNDDAQQRLDGRKL